MRNLIDACLDGQSVNLPRLPLPYCTARKRVEPDCLRKNLGYEQRFLSQEAGGRRQEAGGMGRESEGGRQESGDGMSKRSGMGEGACMSKATHTNSISGRTDSGRTESEPPVVPLGSGEAARQCRDGDSRG